MKKVLSVLLSVVLIFTMVGVAAFSVSAYTSGDYAYTVTDSKATIIRYTGTDSIISIPNTIGDNYSVTSIGEYAFFSCTGLTSVTIPDLVTSIGEYAFFSCTGLTSITIPDLVTSIGGYAFNGCTSLASVIIPDSVTSIGEYAFRGCTGLTNITVDINNSHYSSLDGILFDKNKTVLIQYPCKKNR